MISTFKQIPLCWFPYRKSYYLTHPHKWLKNLWTGIKNFIHRGKCGWTWIDLWDTDTYLLKLIPNMLEELSNRSCGTPNGFTTEEYKEYLKAVALLFRYCQITDYTEEYKAVPLHINKLHSEISICERLYTRAKSAIQDYPKTWQSELTKFCFAELGTMVASGLLWD